MKKKICFFVDPLMANIIDINQYSGDLEKSFSAGQGPSGERSGCSRVGALALAFTQGLQGYGAESAVERAGV